jgi:hypothetical protein
MKKTLFYVCFLVMLVLFISTCSISNDTASTINNTTIERLNKEVLGEIPFENVEVLKGFSDDPQILYYNTARKLALVELMATGMDKEMGWEGCKIEQLPVVIYGFDNRPKYYDFIVTDAEKQIAGTITVYARRTASTSIRKVSDGVKEYRSTLSKSNEFSASFFEDWTGISYLGLRGKSGDEPELVINALTGETVEGIKELDGEEIITTLMRGNFASIQNGIPGNIDISEDDPNYNDIMQAIANYSELEKTPKDIEAALYAALSEQTAKTEAFWSALRELIPEIESIEDEEESVGIDSKGWLSSLISAIVHKVTVLFTTGVNTDTSRYYIDKYTNYSETFRFQVHPNECGAWACSYLVWIKENKSGDTFNSFRSVSSSFGECGICNLALRPIFEPIGGRPMTPAEMVWSLPIISKGKIWMVSTYNLNDSVAYEHIKKLKKPAIVFCESGNQGHYKVAVGARATGTIFSETFYFLFQENNNGGGNKEGNSIRRDADKFYQTVEWWNPWFLIGE